MNTSELGWIVAGGAFGIVYLLEVVRGYLERKEASQIQSLMMDRIQAQEPGVLQRLDEHQLWLERLNQIKKPAKVEEPEEEEEEPSEEEPLPMTSAEGQALLSEVLD